MPGYNDSAQACGIASRGVVATEEINREADKYRLHALSRESRKKSRRQICTKFTSYIGLAKTYKYDDIQMHENHKYVSLVEPKESAVLCCEAATLEQIDLTSSQ